MAHYNKILTELNQFSTERLRRLFHKMDFPYQIYSMNDFNEILMRGRNDSEIKGILYDRYDGDRDKIEEVYYSSYHVVEDGYEIMGSAGKFNFAEFCDCAGIEQCEVIDIILDEYEKYEEEFFYDIVPAEDIELVKSKLQSMTTLGWHRVLGLAFDEGIPTNTLVFNNKELKDHIIGSFDKEDLYDFLTENPQIHKYNFCLVLCEDGQYIKADNFIYDDFDKWIDLTPIIDFVAEFYNCETFVFNKKFKDIVKSHQHKSAQAI